MINVFTDTFPVLVAFENLDMLESQQIAKKALYGLSGIYGFVHIPTGTSYIGSSIDLGGRIMDHINNSSNPHLHNVILKYGLSSFAFVILEYCISSDLLKREQHFLDILFSLLFFDIHPTFLPSLASQGRAECWGNRKKGKSFNSYNFNPTADSRLGATHTPESKAKTSDSISGANNPMYGRTGANHPMFGRTGANNPMYGKVPATAMTVNVNSLDNVLVYSFSSQEDSEGISMVRCISYYRTELCSIG